MLRRGIGFNAPFPLECCDIEGVVENDCSSARVSFDFWTLVIKFGCCVSFPFVNMFLNSNVFPRCWVWYALVFLLVRVLSSCNTLLLFKTQPIPTRPRSIRPMFTPILGGHPERHSYRIILWRQTSKIARLIQNLIGRSPNFLLKKD